MKGKLRETGIDVVDGIPWGTHFCLFYQTKKDLLDILMPYFKAGLENNEFCMWVTSEPLRKEEAKEAMRGAVPHFDQYLEKGQIEVVPHNEWYLKDGVFNQERVMNGWVDKLEAALTQGYDGMRLTGNTFWLGKTDWRDFVKYEKMIDDTIGSYKMIAFCTYSLQKCGVTEVIEVTENHNFALIRRQDKWVALQNAERARTEAALRESEEKLRNILTSSPDAIIATDLKGNILECSQVTLDVYGFSSKEKVIGNNAFDFIAPKDHKRALENMEKTLKQGFIKNVEYTCLTKDGREFPVELSASVIRDSSGKPTSFVSITKDISEQKKAEKTLIQSEKLRALGEMAGGVAHDFNNLLAIILGNAQLLERGLERYKKEEITKRLGIIARTASQGGETVRRLQHFTGREISSDEFTRIDLNEIVRSALRSTSPRWKDEAEAKGITITIKEELGKLPPLLGNESELMEVLTNLIFNAVEAMPDGGRITIKTEAKENDVLLYFTDTGHGIPDKIKINVFDPFFTTKGPKASGLGLSTSYGVIKRHKGDMKVESSKRKGTTFTITIPIPSEIPSEKERLKDSEKVSSQRILVIDDEEGVRDVLARILGEEGHRVSLAETGKKGLDKFKQGDFDLVLTDLGMPDMSGWELAKRIKKINPSLPVGLITGWAVSVTKEKMKEKGVDFILSKPFDCTKVVREVNTYLKFKDQ